MKQVLMAGAACISLGSVCPEMAVAGDQLKFTPGQGAFSWDGYKAFKAQSEIGDLSGEVITIFGPWIGSDRAQVESMIAYFEAATGAEVQYSGSDGFEQQIMIDVAAGSPPNIAIFPQPGLAADMAAKGQLSALTPETANWVSENYAAGQSWVDLATFADADGQAALFGLFYRVDLKSLVWYVPENFEDTGYEVPETLEELEALTDQIAADGATPWCIGIGSGGATGWPATDWVEDMMLRREPPETYDAWVANEVKFTDPKVTGAIEAFGHFARNDAFVAGGARAVASTDFRDSAKGMFTAPPQCYLHRQASFVPVFFPEETEIGLDVDFFYFPAYAKRDLGNPVLGSGSMWSITKDSKGARAFMEFLKLPLAHEIWMAQKGFLTPHKGVNPAVFSDPAMAKMNQILLGADTFRFDGSDLMPGAIGTGAFWSGMVDYVEGKPVAEVAADIQDTWDTLK